MEWVEALDKGFSGAAGFLKLILEAISTLCVFLGLVATVQLALARYRQARSPSLMFMKARLRFGSWLALALEFQLGADIVGTSIAPSINQLIQLAAIAVIRTFLNYFLNKELETEAKLQRE